MKACMVSPGDPTTAGVEDIGEPPEADGAILVDGLLVGVCGTDVEITQKGYGTPPPGHKRLVLFHESLGRVREAPADAEIVLNTAEMSPEEAAQEIMLYLEKEGYVGEAAESNS